MSNDLNQLLESELNYFKAIQVIIKYAHKHNIHSVIDAWAFLSDQINKIREEHSRHDKMLSLQEAGSLLPEEPRVLKQCIDQGMFGEDEISLKSIFENNTVYTCDSHIKLAGEFDGPGSAIFVNPTGRITVLSTDTTSVNGQIPDPEVVTAINAHIENRPRETYEERVQRYLESSVDYLERLLRVHRRSMAGTEDFEAIKALEEAIAQRSHDETRKMSA